MGARLKERDLERLIDSALHRGLTTPEVLIRRFLQLAKRGRDGIATVRSVLLAIDPALAPAESDLETLLAQVIRDSGLPPPVRQFLIAVGGRQIRIDFAYPEQRIAIESDGFSVHGSRSSFESDRERQNLLALDGWTILRFTWRQICENPLAVAEQIRQALLNSRIEP